MKPLKVCVNGDGRDVAPPSKVLCRPCQDAITAKLEQILEEMNQKAAEGRRGTREVKR